MAKNGGGGETHYTYGARYTYGAASAMQLLKIDLYLHISPKKFPMTPPETCKRVLYSRTVSDVKSIDKNRLPPSPFSVFEKKYVF